MLVAPLGWLTTDSVRCHDNVTLWLVRWLAFRLMFASGVVKLTSGCPTWWGLTAMTYHYESQVGGREDATPMKYHCEYHVRGDVTPMTYHYESQVWGGYDRYNLGMGSR